MKNTEHLVPNHRTILVGAMVGLVALFSPTIAVGQLAAPQPGARPAPGKPPVAQPGAPVVNAPKPGAAAPVAGQRPATPPARPGVKAPERPQPKTITLTTADGVAIRTIYFPSDKGKEAVPVILMHEWQGQASPYGGLVKALWDAGCAVVVPEFRGHGGSKEQEVAGLKREFDVSRMGKADVMGMITGDLEAVKKFLVEENNAQRLNLNALTLIGVREGAILASHWAVRDLNFPSVGALKQGQDVKAMVLISPERVIKGVSLEEAVNDRIFVQLPFQIIVGKTSRQASETDRFHKKLEGLKKRMARGEVKDLQYLALPTSLDGASLINDVPGVIEKVKVFIETTMIANAGRIPWVDRQ
ncbi:MAG TPA: alpha/beta hydrolase [Planctomycetaceae bacterium]|nr:alpha/beta hydrolase [Planctomycetaceae bacterium]